MAVLVLMIVHCGHTLHNGRHRVHLLLVSLQSVHIGVLLVQVRHLILAVRRHIGRRGRYVRIGSGCIVSISVVLLRGYVSAVAIVPRSGRPPLLQSPLVGVVYERAGLLSHHTMLQGLISGRHLVSDTAEKSLQRA